jgi:Iron-containing redox enzyme
MKTIHLNTPQTKCTSFFVDRLPRYHLAAKIPEKYDHSLKGLCHKMLLPDEHTFGFGALKRAFFTKLSPTISEAFIAKNPQALTDVHETLFILHDMRCVNPNSPITQHLNSGWVAESKKQIETAWVRSLKHHLKKDLPPNDVLGDPKKLKIWTHEKSNEVTTDPLNKKLLDFFENSMNLNDFKNLLLSDGYISCHFYDIIALIAAQPHCEKTKKLFADQVYEEGGEGSTKEAHTEQFTKTLIEMGIKGLPLVPPWDWRGYAGYNLFVTLSSNRQLYYYGIGSFGMSEKTDPIRNEAIVKGIRRLGLNPEKFSYHSAHATLDVEHGDEAIHLQGQILEEYSRENAENIGRQLALGSLMYLHSANLYKGYLSEKVFNLEPGKNVFSLPNNIKPISPLKKSSSFTEIIEKGPFSGYERK